MRAYECEIESAIVEYKWMWVWNAAAFRKCQMRSAAALCISENFVNINKFKLQFIDQSAENKCVCVCVSVVTHSQWLIMRCINDAKLTTIHGKFKSWNRVNRKINKQICFRIPHMNELHIRVRFEQFCFGSAEDCCWCTSVHADFSCIS